MSTTVPVIEVDGIPKSVFADLQATSFPYRFYGTIHVGTILGGVPSDPKVIEGWLKTKLGLSRDDQIRQATAAVMVERGVDAAAAAEEVAANRNLNGFMRERCNSCPNPAEDTAVCVDGKHPLYIGARQLKAGLKEACSVAVAAGDLTARGWGKTNKGLLGYVAEHIFVVEERLYLLDDKSNPITEPTGVQQHFVHSRFGSAIQYQEYVEGCNIDFTVISDHDFTDKEWGIIWTKGEMQGIGASRSQSYGRYKVTRWDRAK